MRAYHLETRTRKEFSPFWDKHTTVPLMKIALCFGGRIHSRRSHIHSIPIEPSPPARSCFVLPPLYANPLFFPFILCSHAYSPYLLQSPLRLLHPPHTSHVLSCFSIVLSPTPYFAPALWLCVTKYYLFSRHFTSLLPAFPCYPQLYIFLPPTLSPSLTRRTSQPNLSHHPPHLFLYLHTLTYTPPFSFLPFLLPLQPPIPTLPLNWDPLYIMQCLSSSNLKLTIFNLLGAWKSRGRKKNPIQVTHA